MSVLKKYFNSDQDNPPLFQKFITFLVFSFLLLIQYVSNSLHSILPKKFFLLRIAKSLVISSHQLLDKCSYVDDLPPLKLKRTTPEQELAGFRHELDPRYKSSLSSFAAVYNLGAYSRFKTCFHREVGSCPTAVISVRNDDGVFQNAINTCSYNYLGFAEHVDQQSIMGCVEKYGLGCFLNRNVCDLKLFKDLEQQLAGFLHCEDCIFHGMGYDTNALGIMCVATQNSLILSDQYNHNSIVKGCQYSGAKLMKFRHDHLETLEEILSTTDLKLFDKVIVLVEGLYSMEGNYVNLPHLVQLREKYNFLLYVDEAHSIGSVGPNGGGIRDHFGIQPDKVDFNMGTFTKSFSSCGGYIAGKHELIQNIRQKVFFYNQQMALAPVQAQQTINALNLLQTEFGRTSLTALRKNSVLLRSSLKQMGFTVYGDSDSPVVPVLFYNPVKMKFIQDELLKRGIAVVVVGFPAVPLVSARIRFCVSAALSEAQMEYVIAQMDQLGDYLRIKFEK